MHSGTGVRFGKAMLAAGVLLWGAASGGAFADGGAVDASVADSQAFLDENQYTLNGIQRYEYIFGEDFCSIGGLDTTRDLTAQLNLEPGDRVLDVGSGMGGSAFYMAREYGAIVEGVDLSRNMVTSARNKAEQRNLSVSFNILDVTDADFPANSFDVIYSRDVIMHIEDKAALYKKLFKWLKPGGQLLVSDYCTGDGSWTDEFRDYVAARHYHLLTVEDYETMLQNVGFTQVRAENRTDIFEQSLTKELARIQDNKGEFLSLFTSKDYEDLTQGWQIKLERNRNGLQHWGVFHAIKP
ncbi:methyltransferase domain-containing protein [Parendozoicomonas haliclonae]|uniref:Glycine/sarcosine/dimethylglycine N-methyltransferase n=1 Tax=Parendozoicomonas haliclonae TaxID=1960125 RepID=A0A1X7AGZ9_9GAMM|nr:methyltransferase domain-containing protein [Parendozoicomonas haliclonae]SMA41636.1 Glycine/sarcosine/dimethylglycine N-methyltransferase [Parendozoicomonas haliclonae]